MPGPIRFSPEYGGGPLWEHEIGDHLDPVTLGLPPDLFARLMAWDAAYQATLDHDYPPNSDFPTPEAGEAWRREGQAILDALRALGLDVVDRR